MTADENGPRDTLRASRESIEEFLRQAGEIARPDDADVDEHDLPIPDPEQWDPDGEDW